MYQTRPGIVYRNSVAYCSLEAEMTVLKQTLKTLLKLEKAFRTVFQRMQYNIRLSYLFMYEKRHLYKKKPYQMVRIRDFREYGFTAWL
jgi:hypothetical protein